MIIVDTSVWIDFYGGVDDERTGLLRRLVIEPIHVGVPDVVYAELLQGLRNERDMAIVRADLDCFSCHDVGGRDNAIRAALNYRTLRGKGSTVRKTIDCLIATYCIAHGFALLHADRDFELFERHLGLQVWR